MKSQTKVLDGNGHEIPEFHLEVAETIENQIDELRGFACKKFLPRGLRPVLWY